MPFRVHFFSVHQLKSLRRVIHVESLLHSSVFFLWLQRESTKPVDYKYTVKGLSLVSARMAVFQNDEARVAQSGQVLNHVFYNVCMFKL